MAFFSLTFDKAPGAGLGAALTGSAAAAIARGLNRTATSERAAMSTAIARDMGVKVGTVKAAIRISKAGPSNLEARVTAKGRPLPLIAFKARGPEPSRGRGRGVSTSLGPKPHAFIARMPTGHRGVFERKGRGRLPIRELYGDSIVSVFTKHIPLGAARRQAVLEKNVAHELAYALSRVKG